MLKGINFYRAGLLVGVLMILTYARASAASAPSAGTLSPSNGALAINTTIRITCTYSDADGAADLSVVYLLLNTSASGVNGIYLAYNRQANKLYLRNDADTGWLGGFAPGQATSVQNSRVRLLGQTTSVSTSGNTLTVNWSIQPLGANAGATLKAYLRALDSTGLHSGWVQRGTLTFKYAPVGQSVTPNSGSAAIGAKTTVSSVYTDADGTNDLSVVYFLVNTTASGTNAIYLAYNRQTNRLFVRNDTDTAWLGGVAPGSSGTISNSQVRLYCQETTVSSTSAGLQVNWRIEPLAPMAGRSCKGYLRAWDLAGLGSSWTEKASYTFTSPPVGQSVTPASGNLAPGVKYTVSSVYTDPDGTSDLKVVYFLLNTVSTSGVGGVYLAYNRPDNKLYLRNDTDTAWLGGVAPGSSGTISNSRVRLYCQETTVSSTSAGLQVNWRIEPLNPMSGVSYKGFLRAIDASNLASAWAERASLSVGRPPVNQSFSPLNAEFVAGEKTTVTASFSDPDGASNIATVYVLLNSSVDGAGAGYIAYELPPKNKLWVRNDAHSAWLGGVALGSPGVIENSQIRVYSGESTLVTGGSQVELNLRIEAKRPLAGRDCGAWLRCVDQQGLASSWTRNGSLAFSAPPLSNSIAVFPARLSLKQGGNPAIVRAVVIDADGKVVSNPIGVSWTVANTSLATVEPLGMDGLGEYLLARVTPSASSTGSTAIQVSANGLSGRIELSVAAMAGWEELHPVQNPAASATIAQGQQRVYFFQTDPDVTFMLNFEAANDNMFRMELFDNPSLTGPPLRLQESSGAGWDIPATRLSGTWFVRLTRLAPSSGGFSIELEADPDVYNTQDSPSVPVWHRVDPGGPGRFGTVGRRDGFYLSFEAQAGKTYYVEGGGPGRIVLAGDPLFANILHSSESSIGYRLTPTQNGLYFLWFSGGEGGGFAGAKVSLPYEGYVSQPVLQLYPRTLLMDEADSRSGDLALWAPLTGAGGLQTPPATVAWSASSPQISVTGTGVQNGAQTASVTMGTPVNGRIQVAADGQKARITHFGFIPVFRAMGDNISKMTPGVPVTDTVAVGAEKWYYLQTIPGAVYQFTTTRVTGTCDVFIEKWEPPTAGDGEDQPIPDIFIAQCPWAVGTIVVRVENNGTVPCQFAFTAELLNDGIQPFVPYTMEQITLNAPVQVRRVGYAESSLPYEEEALLYFDSPQAGVAYRLEFACTEGRVYVMLGEETTFQDAEVSWVIPAGENRTYSFTPPTAGKRYFLRIKGLEPVSYFSYRIVPVTP